MLSTIILGRTENGHVNKAKEVYIQGMTDQVKLIQEWLKAAQSRQKSYAEIGDGISNTFVFRASTGEE
jgi:hypothetical protein